MKNIREIWIVADINGRKLVQRDSEIACLRWIASDKMLENVHVEIKKVYIKRHW